MPKIQQGRGCLFVIIPSHIIKQTNWEKGVELFFDYHYINNNKVAVVHENIDKEETQNILDDIIKVFGR